MSSIKCKKCGLSNFATDVECRRCGNPFEGPKNEKKERSPRSFSLSTLLMIAIVAAVAYYFFTGVKNSTDQVTANDAKRVAAQANDNTAALSRTEYDRQRSERVGNAVLGTNSFSEHNQHIDDTQRAMQAASNSQGR